MDINLTINDQNYQINIKENWTLLYVLREVLNLTGAKYGCGTGDCGACKVLIDGVAINSCTTLARNVQNRKIVTIEGLGHKDKLHPIQEAFIEAGAVQCGYCTPGMIISTAALLAKNLAPTDDDICKALDGNICRCTGYIKIIDAVKLAAGKMRGEKNEF